MQSITGQKPGKISIIVPYWGSYVRYLPDCIESISNQTYKDYEIIIIDNKTDLPSARNEGIRRAKGDYIVCLDADDTIEPQFLEKLVGVDDITCPTLKEFGDSSAIWSPPKKHPVLEDFKIDNQLFCSSMFKKEVWEKIGGYDENMKDGYEDWDFWLRATEAGFTITTIPDVLFNYRRHGKTMITETVKKHNEIKDYMINKLK